MNKDNKINDLTQLNEDLENYFSNTIIPQLFVDADLILRKFTPPAMKQFDLKPEFIGMSLENIRGNFRFPTFINNINTVMATGKILEKEIQTTDLRWYQMNILPYHVRKENRTNGVIITFVDITPRVRDLKEQERLVLEHELLLDTIAHDIKNPLLVLNLTFGLMKEVKDRNSEKFLPLMQNHEKSLIEIKKIIHDLTESRWEKQKYQASSELVDLPNILEDVRLSLAQQLIETDAIIHQDLAVSEFYFVRRKLRSVLYNLINNAVKYTPETRPPEILVRSFIAGDYIVVSVKDNGIGMGAKDKETIFEKFTRATKLVDGSGVGLYLVNTIVKQAGGKIDLISVPGQGTEIKIFLKQS
ncbi:ATP-binding protein [Sphingobacterium sp. UBA1498]|uniref:sensor histidine kinase n=1 Tax=Sphingobacterium sp. UBA1498 TaxID=1947481 RepID=UPI0025F5CF13|nr:ATP-binding protein [Sphingobacterium sp. UBA1498]